MADIPDSQEEIKGPVRTESDSITDGKSEESEAKGPLVDRSLSVPLREKTSIDIPKSKSSLTSMPSSISKLSQSEKMQLDAKIASFLKKMAKKVTVTNGAVTIASNALSNLPNFLHFIGPEIDLLPEDSLPREIPTAEPPGSTNPANVPPISICILIVGTRGDVQPFIAIGLKLKEYGHRVRLATHANFRDFVTGQGLEFYPLGGDPKVLAEYMVNNKGFLPSRPSEVSVQRKQLKAIIMSTWDACTKADTESNGLPFFADAIIANPPTMGHTHVAEALKVPLHVFFTMPWTPTHKWPHPLARVGQIVGFENRLTYYLVDNMIWLGVADIVNAFRKKLGLAPLMYNTLLTRENHVTPMGYIWSPSLAPKPDDWGASVDVVGFCFLNLASDYEPPPELVEFLKAGPPPIFIGFGSLPVQKPKKVTEIIVQALEKTNQRGIIQKGWAGLGEMDVVPPNIFLLGNCPHDWLFPQCAAVVHHGGAGTTAAGLISACPTTVVPFFGDQPFWGNCVREQGVGPEPIPSEQLDLDRLTKAILFMLKPEVKTAAEKMAEKIKREDGVQGAVDAFLKNLPADIQPGKHDLAWRKDNNWTTWFCSCGRNGIKVSE